MLKMVESAFCQQFLSECAIFWMIESKVLNIMELILVVSLIIDEVLETRVCPKISNNSKTFGFKLSASIRK